MKKLLIMAFVVIATDSLAKKFSKEVGDIPSNEGNKVNIIKFYARHLRLLSEEKQKYFFDVMAFNIKNKKSSGALVTGEPDIANELRNKIEFEMLKKI